MIFNRYNYVKMLSENYKKTSLNLYITSKVCISFGKNDLFTGRYEYTYSGDLSIVTSYTNKLIYNFISIVIFHKNKSFMVIQY